MAPLTTRDRLEIRELAARYSWADDTADGEAFADVFTPDGIFKSARHNARGHAELAALGRSIAPEPPLGIQHWITNLVLEGDTERAHGRCYFVLHGSERGQVSSSSLGYYEDELVKHDGRWRFAQRHFRPWPPRDGDD